MPSETQVLAIDRCPDRRPEKRCTRCRHWKPCDEFSRDPTRASNYRNWCKQCNRLTAHAYYHEGGGKEKHAEYLAREGVKRRTRERDKRVDVKRRHNERNRIRAATPRGKLTRARSNARFYLARAATDERRAELLTLIAMCDREIARLDARKAAEQEAELPAKVTAPRDRKCGKSPCRGVYCTPAGTFEVRVSVGKSRSVRGGTFATLDEARAAANELAFKLRGERNYAIPREERRRV
jgi:hypothetical protein